SSCLVYVLHGFVLKMFYDYLVLSDDLYFYFFFFNDPATTEIYTLSLHDALPISCATCPTGLRVGRSGNSWRATGTWRARHVPVRSEEHTSELQSRSDLVCRLLLEKKKKKLKKMI